MVPLRRRIMAGVGFVAVLALLTACVGASETSPGESSSVPPESRSASPTDPETVGPTEPGIPDGASPLSGRAGGADRPLLAVKIDNTRAAQPHAGLSSADVVYVEEVEWGLTRFIALFSTEMPDIVGPVRSARIADIEILAPFGDIPFAYSGAQSRLLPLLAGAEFIDASANANYSAWFDDPARRSPTDHMVRPAVILDAFDGGAVARDIGWVFSEEPPPGGRQATEASAEWGSSTVGFRWDADAGDYVVIIDGVDSRAAEGGSQRAATVIIQSVRQFDSGYGDRYGGVTPGIETVGNGSAMVLRNGRMWEVTWERPTAQDGTRYLLPDGSPMPFAIGQEWIVLLDEERMPIVR